jgi:hypothetical protein
MEDQVKSIKSVFAIVYIVVELMIVALVVAVPGAGLFGFVFFSVIWFVALVIFMRIVLIGRKVRNWSEDR